MDALVADVHGEPGALPLLSTALLELWQERDGARLSYPAYDRSGGVHGAVARLAERVYGQLGEDERPRARALLVRLAGIGEEGVAVRRRLPLAELERTPGAAEVLWKLADGRLVTVSDNEAEVAHEALLREWPRLRGWLEEDAEGRRLHHRLGDRRARVGRGRPRPRRAVPRRAACRGARLVDVARPGARGARARVPRRGPRRGHPLAAAPARGAGRRRRAARARRRSPASVALHQRGSARDEATAADAQRLGSRALAENDLDRSLLLARQGVALDDSPQTRGSLLAALNKSPAAIGVMRGVGERMSAIALSPDGRTLAAGDAAGNLFLFDTRTRRRVTAPDVQPGDWPIVQLAYSPDGRRLAIAHGAPDGNVVTLMDARTRRLSRPLQLYDFDRAVTALRFEGEAALDVASRPGRDARHRCARWSSAST